MPQKSRKIGNVTLIASLTFVKLEKQRAILVEKRRQEQESEVTRKRVVADLKRLSTYLKRSGDEDIDANLVANLLKQYDDLFAQDWPEKATQEFVVNLELTLLKRHILNAPENIRVSFMARLEDLFASCARGGFTNDGASPNEKLESIGKLIRRGRVYINWNRFPIMETFMVSDTVLLERTLDRGTQMLRLGSLFD